MPLSIPIVLEEGSVRKKALQIYTKKNNASVMDLNTVEQWTAEAVSEYFESLGTPFKDYAKAFLGKS